MSTTITSELILTMIFSMLLILGIAGSGTLFLHDTAILELVSSMS